MGEDVKRSRYPPGDLRAGQVLLPAAIESFGRMGQRFNTLLRELGEMAHVLRGWPRWYFWDKWAPKIGACLAVGNHLKIANLRSEYSGRRIAGVIASASSSADHWDHTIDLTGPAESPRRSATLRQPLRSQRLWRRREGAGAGVQRVLQRAAGHMRRASAGAFRGKPDGVAGGSWRSRGGQQHRGWGGRGPSRGGGNSRTRARARRRGRGRGARGGRGCL